MTNTVELLLRLKPDWERAYREYAAESAGDLRLSTDEVARLIDVMLEGHLTGESRMLRHLLDDWLSAPDAELADHITFDQYQSTSLINALHAIRAIVTLESQRLYKEGDLQAIYRALDTFFTSAVEYIAYTEAMRNLRHAQRRQSELQADLEKLDQSRASFVSIAAHGLKTPLTLVEGYSQMLREQLAGTESETVPLMDGIESGTRRMRELIDDLVDVAMIDNKMLSLYYQPMRLDEMISNVVKQLGTQIETKELKLTIEGFDGGDQIVFADRERLEQALVEVVDNAIVYTPAKGAILISGRSFPGFVEVSVKDSGVGIAPENQTRIFEQFGRITDGAKKTGSVNSASSGLGLHLSKGILEAHGGAIWVDSPGFDEDRCPGSTFHLMIPARRDPPDDPSMKLLGKARG